MSKAKDKIKALPASKKVQLIAAFLLTLIIMIAIPVAAWFGSQRRIIKLQKIQSPNMLILSAAHREDKMYFEIDGINVDEGVLKYVGQDDSGAPKTEAVKITDDSGNEVNKKITHKDYVFCITGDAVDEFTIQLAYTTNNPFKYQVYAANEYGSFSELLNSKKGDKPVVGEEVEYISYIMKGDPAAESFPSIDDAVEYDEDTIIYYTIDEGCENTVSGQYIGEYLNDDDSDGKADNDSYYSDTYTDDDGPKYTNVQQDAIPIYWQAKRVQAFPGKSNPNKKPFSRNFILRVSWSAEDKLSNASKETDIVYLSVKATS